MALKRTIAVAWLTEGLSVEEVQGKIHWIFSDEIKTAKLNDPMAKISGVWQPWVDFTAFSQYFWTNNHFLILNRFTNMGCFRDSPYTTLLFYSDTVAFFFYNFYYFTLLSFYTWLFIYGPRFHITYVTVPYILLKPHILCNKGYLLSACLR